MLNLIQDHLIIFLDLWWSVYTPASEETFRVIEFKEEVEDGQYLSFAFWLGLNKLAHLNNEIRVFKSKELHTDVVFRFEIIIQSGFGYTRFTDDLVYTGWVIPFSVEEELTNCIVCPAEPQI